MSWFRRMHCMSDFLKWLILQRTLLFNLEFLMRTISTIHFIIRYYIYQKMYLFSAIIYEVWNPKTWFGWNLYADKCSTEWLILRRLGITSWLDKDKLNVLSLSKPNTSVFSCCICFIGVFLIFNKKHFAALWKVYQATGETGFHDRENLINHKLLPYAQRELSERNKRLLTFFLHCICW